jgi:hypothetical protein
MSGRVLDFSQYLGGADNVKVIEMFPRTEKKFQYNFGADVSAFSFSADQHSILLDKVSYDRATGLPNFTETVVLGFFNNNTAIGAGNIDSTQAAQGLVTFTIPQNRYTGNIVPNARENVVMTVVGFQWDGPSSNTQPSAKELHRWAIIERWEPGVTPGDPKQNTGGQPAYTALQID